MKQLINQKAKRIFSTLAAGVLAGSAALMLAGCTSAHPEVKITVEFNSETYELDYTLYRKMYPSTVQHFLELAENGYYDGLCVHNYTGSGAFFYTGAYSYNEADTANGYGGLEYKPYFETVKTYETFTQSVFDVKSGEGTYTLYGEFNNNGYSVENNALKHKFGSLVMYYEENSSTQKVNVQYSSSKKLGIRDYNLNAATSEFYIFGGSSSSANDPKYCVFGELKDEDVLTNLKSAISSYTSDQGEDYTFTTEYRVQINLDDPYAEKDRVSYFVPNEPILIRSVRVTKF